MTRYKCTACGKILIPVKGVNAVCDRDNWYCAMCVSLADNTSPRGLLVPIYNEEDTECHS